MFETNHTNRIERILALEGMREEVEKYITEKGYERLSYAENIELDREYPGLAMGYGLNMDYVIASMLEDNVAKRMGVTQSTVSRLEDSRWQDMKLGELDDYLKAMKGN